MLALLALTRVGIRHFWAAYGRALPQLRWLEGLPIAGLLLLGVVLTVQAEPVMRYMQAASAALHAPQQGYIKAVMSARPIPTAKPAADAAKATKP